MERRAQPVLSPAEVAALAAETARVQAESGHPVDLEWAMVGKRLVLQQFDAGLVGGRIRRHCQNQR